MNDAFYEKKDAYGDSDKWNDDRKKKCLSLIKKVGPKNFLDIGCGDGYFALYVRDATGANITGIDISETASEIARTRGIHTVTGDITQPLPFDDASFDTVFCGEVIEHIVDTDFLLDEIERVLRKGGHLIMTTPNLASWYNRLLFLFGIQPIFTEVSLRKKYGHVFAILGEGGLPVGHLRVFTQASFVGLLRDHHFDIDSIQSSGWLNCWKEGSIFYKIDIIISRYFPSLGSNLIILAQKHAK